MGAVMTIGPSQ